jgi:mono/diheme cytochrome c family protein
MKRTRGASAIATGLLALAAAGCHRDMRDQPRYDLFEASDFFADGQAARPRVEGTIARGELAADDPFATGREGGGFVQDIPVELNAALLKRGQQRFDIYCAVCHAPTGSGNGMIVQRGFRHPPSLHDPRLRAAPVGHFFDVITHGFGAMPSYRAQIPPADRWAIIAHLRVLQRSQHATLDDVPPEEQQKLRAGAP